MQPPNTDDEDELASDENEAGDALPYDGSSVQHQQDQRMRREYRDEHGLSKV